MHHGVHQVVEVSFPKEAFGLFIRGKGNAPSIRVHRLTGNATERWFVADAAGVIELAYTLVRQGDEVVGTFHSHPTGVPTMSVADEALSEWSSTHLLVTKSLDSAAWRFLWFQVDQGSRRS